MRESITYRFLQRSWSAKHHESMFIIFGSSSDWIGWIKVHDRNHQHKLQSWGTLFLSDVRGLFDMPESERNGGSRSPFGALVHCCYLSSLLQLAEHCRLWTDTNGIFSSLALFVLRNQMRINSMMSGHESLTRSGSNWVS